MNILLKLEQIGITLLGVYLFSMTGYSWWLFLLLFFAPDIGMAGYLINPKIGAVLYNLFHHQGLAAVVIIIGFILADPVVIGAGAILLSHTAFDRILGFGLKYSDSFKHTHLGWIGNKKTA